MFIILFVSEVFIKMILGYLCLSESNKVQRFRMI